MDNKKYISKIVQGENTLYIKDEEARKAIGDLQAYTDYLGVTTTALSDGATVATIKIGEENVTAVKGNIVNYGAKEYIFNGTAWQEFGDLSAIGALGYADSATGSVTAAGNNAASAVSFSGTESGNFVTGVDTAAVNPSFTEGAFTPASFQDGFYTAGQAASYSHSGFEGGSLGDATTGNFTTEGIIASYTESSETLTLTAANTSSAVTAQGTFTAAVYGTDTFDGGAPTSLDLTKFNGGSKSADTFNAGSAATFSTASAITSLGTATAAAQVFTGTAVDVTVNAAE